MTNPAGFIEAYTEGVTFPEGLRSAGARRTQRRFVLCALAIGFALVISLLAVAAYIAVRRSQEIRGAAAEWLREQRISWGVVDDLRLVQQRVSTLLFELFDDERDSPAMRRRIAALEAAIGAASTKGGKAAPHPAWRELTSVGVKFTSAARELLAAPVARRPEIEQELQDLRNRFAALSNEIVDAQALEATRLEARIEQQSEDLVREAVQLLGGCLLLAVIGAAVTIRLTHRSFQTMEWQTAELNRISWQMLQTQEETARRFSHEMHDELGQALAGLKALLLAVNAAEFIRRRSEAVRLIDEAIGNVRELSQLLRPVILDDFGLQAGLSWLADRFRERTQIDVECVADLDGRLDDEAETHLFRIAQEALTNIARHSGATKVWIRISGDRKTARLVIEDNGRGLPEQPFSKPSLGMLGMRARARAIGGELRVDSKRPGGVRIEAWAPRKS